MPITVPPHASMRAGLKGGGRSRAATLCRPAAREWPGIAPGRAVVGPLISVHDLAQQVQLLHPEWVPRRNVLWGSFNGLAYVPRLPPTAYTLLLHAMTEQEPGGLVVATHDELAAGLAMERGMISRAMPHLVAARLVTVVRRGRFQIHPMIA